MFGSRLLQYAAAIDYLVTKSLHPDWLIGHLKSDIICSRLLQYTADIDHLVTKYLDIDR